MHRLTRNFRSPICSALVILLLVASATQALPPPDLVPGVWTNIGPTAVTPVDYGTANVTIDPSNPPRPLHRHRSTGHVENHRRGIDLGTHGQPC